MTDNRTCLRQQIIEEIASRWLEWYWNHGAKHGAVRSKSQMRRTVAMVS
jgi:hypothetical protein